MDLVTFLRERLDELELGGPGHCAGCTSGPEFAGTMYACDCDSVRAYMLADVAAKRRVVGRHRRYGEVMPSVYPPWDDACDGCGFPGDPEWPATEHTNDCPELRDLAAPFASHPDFDPAWAVEA